MENRLKAGSRSYHRFHCAEENEATRIPVPSPTPFRRAHSLRVRGERCHLGFGRCKLSPLSPSQGYFPVITESKESLRDSGVCNGAAVRHNGDLPHRTRSFSLNLNVAAAAAAAKSQRSPKDCHPISDFSHLTIHHVEPHTPPGSPEGISDDVESLNSYSSIVTAASCDGGYAARNGTTFSGRSMKYVLHCSSHAGLTGDEYLTPTQRAQKQIKRLKILLAQAKADLEEKDSDIFRLTKEVVELRLYKASVCSPDDKSNSSDAVTVRENICDDMQSPDSPNVADLTDDGPIGSKFKLQSDYKTRSPSSPSHEMQSSYADSGHFEDMTNSSVHSKDSIHIQMVDKACSTDPYDKEEERLKLISIYEQKLEAMTRKHIDETQEMKTAHNDKVEALLQKLSDVNTRYCELVPDCEQAKEKIRELERQLEEVSKQLAKEEEKHHKMYLQMYNKGQEAARFEEIDKALDPSLVSPSRISVPDLLHQLEVTQQELDNIRDINFSPERLSPRSEVLLSAKEAVSLWVLGARKAMYRRIVEAQKGTRSSVDPEVTLQFLKSAIYYFLTDPINHQGHLNAIESILGFSESEKRNIQRARTY